jgi:hypothetical protein
MASIERAQAGAERTLGYFAHLALGERHLGAILVTNRIGVPIEFKYTEPVAVTRVHRALYGAVLQRYIHESLIRDRLATEVRSEPEFFLASFEEREFLGPIAGRPMIAIERGQPGAAPAGSGLARVREHEGVVGLEQGAPLRVIFSSPDEALQRQLAARLADLAQTLDLFEPFHRIRSALTLLCSDERRISRAG